MMRLYSMLFFCLLGCLPQTLQATHMVGGEINYRCLGNNRYEIVVTVFRDCDTGVPWFDNPASVGVFDNNDSLIYDLRLNLRNNDTLDLNLSDPCLVAPPNVCIHTTTYLDTVILPFQPGGYQIVYQRCCRNRDIVNIVAPTSTGATYSSFISEEALRSCNSSARFNEWPPVYVCAGVPINYDHSATDQDGDSIVYELCTPFTGATAAQSMPQPPNNPPYNNVTWRPPYSIDNMLGGPDSLKIDPTTGLLTGTPDIVGVFVVGVCAKEYRNGQLISTTRRDFQYVVGICGRAVSSAFFAPNIQCDNSLVVNFQNASTTLGTGYLWSFGDPLTGATSTYANPSYIYPDTGYYTITLIADPGTLCADTAQQTIYLQYQSLDVGFDVQTASCTDSFYLHVTDLSIDSISTIVRWAWDFGNGLTDTIPFSSTVYDTSGTYIIRLQVLAANGCTASFEDTLQLRIPTIFSDDSVGICPGDSSIVLNPGGDPTHVYQWAPAVGLSSTTSASPIATVTRPVTYQVTVTAPNGLDTCRLVRSITVLPAPPIGLTLTRDTFTCMDSIHLVAISNPSVSIVWSTNPNFVAPLYWGDTLPIGVTNSQWYYVRASDVYGCSVQDSVGVVPNTQPVFPTFSYTGTGCTNVGQVQFADQTMGLNIQSWQWTFGDGDSSSLQNPLHIYAQSGSYEVRLQVITTDGCTGEYKDSLTWLLPQLMSGDSTGICPSDSGVVLNPGGNPNLLYQWSPSASLNNPFIASPYATPPSLPATYTVVLTSINGTDTCQATDQVLVLASPPITVNVPPRVIYCGDSVTLTAVSPTAVRFDWSLVRGFTPIIATGNSIRVQPQTPPLSGFYVQATNNLGCTATDFVIAEQDNNAAQVDFAYQSSGCSDTVRVQFTDRSIDSVSNPIVTWNWTTSDGQSSNAQNPVFVFRRSGILLVRLTVTLANGCMAFKEDVLQFNLARLTGDTALVWCDGVFQDTLNRGGDPSLQYRWSPGSSLSSVTAAAPQVTLLNPPQTYTVTITGLGSLDTCISIQQITVRRAPPILIEVPKDTVYCGGIFNVRATISNATRFDWSFSPTFNPAILTNLSSFFVGLPAPPFDLNIYVRAVNQYGCLATDTARILRRDIAIPVSFATQVTSCVDTLDAIFTNTTSFPSNLILQGYRWDLGNGQTPTTLNAATRYPNTPNPIVRLTATSTNGCIGTYADTLDYRLPRLYGPDSIGLCQNDSVQLNIGGDSLLFYQWSPSIGLSAPNSASPWASPTQNTLYTVTVTSPNGGDTCHQVHTVLVNVDPFDLQPMNDTVLCTNRVALNAHAPLGSIVEWSLNAGFTQIIGVGDPLVTAVNDPRWFYLRATNPYGCIAEDSILVRYIGEGLQVGLDWLPLTCGDSLLVQWQGSASDSSAQQWNWTLGNGQQSTLQNPLAWYIADSVYTVRLAVQGVGVCVGQAERDLIVALPELDLPVRSLVICDGTAVQLGSTGRPDLVYQWSPSTGVSDPTIANPSFSPSTTTTYRVRVTGTVQFGTDVDSCWLEDSIQVIVHPAPSLVAIGDSITCDSSLLLQIQNPLSSCQYRWALDPSFGTPLSTQVQFQAPATPLQRWVYVQVEDSLGCQTTDSLSVQSQGLALALSRTTPQCDTQLLILPVTNTGASATTYVWSPVGVIQAGQGTATAAIQATSSTTVRVIGSNTYGCVDTAETLVVIAPPINLIVDPDTLLCDSGTVVLNSSANTAQSYQWSDRRDMSTVLGQNSQLTTNVVDLSTVYYVQVVDGLGCMALDSVRLDYQPAVVALNTSLMGCKDSTLQLVATGTTGTYQWQGSQPILGGQGSPQITINGRDSAAYRVQVTNAVGCTAVDSVVVLPPPLVRLGLQVHADQDTVAPGTTVQLLATNEPTYQYNWQGGVNNPNNYNPTVTLDQTGVFYVTITDDRGCSLEDSVVVWVTTNLCEEPHVFIPNAFSPDGDGYNDIIYVKGNHLTHINFVIYDRWGERIFETQTLGVGWNGRYKGKACPPDVYGYYMECHCLDGTRLVKKGNITLLR